MTSTGAQLAAFAQHSDSARSTTTTSGRGDTNGQANGSGERAVISDIARTGDGEGHAPAVTGEHAAVRGARYLNRSAESLGRFTRPD
jgi:hypothetical protein